MRTRPLVAAVAAATLAVTGLISASASPSPKTLDVQRPAAAQAHAATAADPCGYTAAVPADKAPCTTYAFRFLAERLYYNLTHCHRLVTQRIFVLQCGDPTGTGSGGPGYSFNDENLTDATYPAGTVAMANAGPNTNGSQFFFTWKDTTLRPNYTPFGVVIKGMDVLEK